MTTKDWIDELLDNILWVGKQWGASNVKNSGVPFLEEAPIKHTDQARQAILQKLHEEYKRGYIDGGISQLTKQEEQ